MNLPPARRLASFVEPQVDDKRIDRAWAAVSSCPIRAGFSWKLVALPATVVAAAAVIGLVVERAQTAPPALAGMVIESAASETVTLSEGTRVTLRDGARLRFDRVQSDRVESTVERGQVVFDVKHDGSRAFVVHAPGIEVLDRGTRFTVDVEGGVVAVSVEEGSVEIDRTGSAPVRLAGGEAWSNGPTAAQAPSTPPTASAPPVADTSAAAAQPSTTPSVEAAIKPAEPRTPTPQELLQTANEARLAGHPKDAAAAFDALRRRFRSDPRAGLAAFELGRLRLDSLGDPAGAVEALNDAVALAPSGPFREDADARLVQAYDRTHDARCSTARQAYLTRYPNGIHSADVTARCP
jgi:transmembrane sensor